MNSLNLGSDDEPVIKKKSNTRNLKIALGLAAVILIPTIGSTLAGTITINSSGTVEFGQGISQATACGDLTLTPATSLVNASGAGSFKLATVTLVMPIACTGKTFTIKALGNSSNTLIDLSTRSNDALAITPTITSSSCTVAIPTSPATANETATCTSTSETTATAVITVTTQTASASDIYKFTVESS